MKYVTELTPQSTKAIEVRLKKLRPAQSAFWQAWLRTRRSQGTGEDGEEENSRDRNGKGPLSAPGRGWGGQSCLGIKMMMWM